MIGWTVMMNMRESTRTFGEKYKEHLKAPSPIHGHNIIIENITNMDNFSLIGREGLCFAKTIKESIYIRVNNPTLNRNIGNHSLPHI